MRKGLAHPAAERLADRPRRRSARAEADEARVPGSGWVRRPRQGPRRRDPDGGGCGQRLRLCPKPGGPGWGARRCGLAPRDAPGRPGPGAGGGAAPLPPAPRAPARPPRPRPRRHARTRAGAGAPPCDAPSPPYVPFSCRRSSRGATWTRPARAHSAVTFPHTPARRPARGPGGNRPLPRHRCPLPAQAGARSRSRCPLPAPPAPSPPTLSSPAMPLPSPAEARTPGAVLKRPAVPASALPLSCCFSESPAPRVPPSPASSSVSFSLLALPPEGPWQSRATSLPSKPRVRRWEAWGLQQRPGRSVALRLPGSREKFGRRSALRQRCPAFASALRASEAFLPNLHKHRSPSSGKKTIYTHKTEDLQGPRFLWERLHRRVRGALQLH